jgi:hypothetical protein
MGGTSTTTGPQPNQWANLFGLGLSGLGAWGGGGGRADGKAPLMALADDAGAVIAMNGPELPPFLKRSA